MDIQSNQEKFVYLFELQKSGETNMFGAGSYLQNEFGMSRQDAKDVVLYWMNNYEDVAKALSIEV